MNTQANSMENRLDKINSLGYVICSITEGRMDPEARFAIADPKDDDDGFYLECATLEELASEFFGHFAELA